MFFIEIFSRLSASPLVKLLVLAGSFFQQLRKALLICLELMCRQQVQKTDGDPKIIPFALEILRSLSGNAQLGMDGKVRDIFSCRAVRKQTFAMGTYISIHCQHLQHLPQLSFVDTWDVPADRRLDLRFRQRIHFGYRSKRKRFHQDP